MLLAERHWCTKSLELILDSEIQKVSLAADWQAQA